MVTPKANTSAATVDSHIPSTPQINGKVKIAAAWNTKVRRKDMAAEINPLPRAVKKEEPKIAKPEKRKEKEKKKNAREVSRNSPSSYPVKI